MKNVACSQEKKLWIETKPGVIQMLETTDKHLK